MKIKVICSWCRKEFYKARYRYNETLKKRYNHHFCSVQCGQKFHSKYPSTFMVKNYFKKGQIPWMKGRKLGFIPEKAFKKGYIPWHKGKQLECLRGENSCHWKGGITPINITIRASDRYKFWRKSVFERDHYTCLG